MQKGFTIVELLAVLILLAIVSTVTYLIVGNTINNSKDKLSSVQIDNVIEAAKSYYLKEGMSEENIDSSSTETCVNLSYLVDNGYIDNVEVKDLATKEKITASVKIKYSNNKYKYEYIEEECSICKLVDGTQNTLGAKYTCEVKEDTNYNFYVLSTNDDGTTNLIMERNICEDGTPATAEKICLVAYNAVGKATDVGPVTAITYLNNATSTWENIDNLDLTYDDEGGNFTGFVLNGKARLPYKSEISDYDSTNKTNAYLYDYLTSYNDIQANGVSGIKGYWTLASNASDPYDAWRVFFGGSVSSTLVGTDVSNGVRPVITLKL